MHQELQNTLGMAIANGSIPPDTVLTLVDICDSYSVSRSVARSAVGTLEALGMLRAKRRVGVQVLPVSNWDVLSPRVIAWRLQGEGRGRQLHNLTALRLGVEPEAAAASAKHCDGAVARELMRLAELMQDMGTPERSEEFIEVDARYHELLMRGCGNEFFAALSVPVVAAIRGRADFSSKPIHPNAAALQLHLDIAAAIGRRDPDTAAHSVHELLSEVSEAVDLDYSLGDPTGYQRRSDHR